MNTDLLKYDASSIRELLRRKLLESGAYTDQIYPGSDISILIDMFSWTFNVLTYMLNENASNILFDDAQIYDNLNKMVKLLSYNPRAYSTSTANFNISLNENSFKNETIICTIPKFATITNGHTDSYGNDIRYSFVEDYTFNIINGVLKLPKYKPVLYNGVFRKYTFTNKSAGAPFELFIMRGIGPNEDIPELIDNDTMHVYVENINENGTKSFKEAKLVKNLVLDATSEDLACESRVNEYKNIELKFGDGQYGKRLKKGDTVHIIYLKSNGSGGVFDSGTFSSTEIEIKIEGFASKTELINLVYGGAEMFVHNYSPLFTNDYIPLLKIFDFTLTNNEKSTEPINYEDVESIKSFAPASFRIGNRLITASDFRTHILNTFRGIFKDVYVCNNNEYCMLFYRWLDRYDHFNVNIRSNNYEYADACDFNNIYIFLNSARPEGILNSDKNHILKECDSLKPLTSKLIPCDGVHSYLMPFIGDVKILTKDYVFGSSFVPNTRILIKKGFTYFTDSQIISNVSKTIVNFFEENFKFGAKINLADLQERIFSLGYVESIKTVYKDDTNNYYINGLSFVRFTPDLIDMYDAECFTQILELEKFQYCTLFRPENISKLISITNENTFSLNNDEF